MPAKERLILAFDAFGTLFTPREPIAKSYADIARKWGLSGFTNDQIASSFRDAFKQESKNAPNYGKKFGMAAPRWWSNVIHATFRPFSSCKALPVKLVPELLRRFSTSEGYMMYSDVPPFFKRLRRLKQAAGQDSNVADLRVGIITNSDDRVFSILSSLGLSTGPLRYGTNMDSVTPGVHIVSESGEMSDVDFITLSYDVGFEKPSHQIFDAAKELGRLGWVYEDRDKVRYIHVGDDLDKDVHGAQQAAWEGILLDREGTANGSGLINSIISNLLDLESHIPSLSSGQLKDGKASTESTGKLQIQNIEDNGDKASALKTFHPSGKYSGILPKKESRP